MNDDVNNKIRCLYSGKMGRNDGAFPDYATAVKSWLMICDLCQCVFFLFSGSNYN